MRRSASCLGILAVLVGFFVPPAHADSDRPQCDGPGGCGTQQLTAWDRQYYPGCGPPPPDALLPGDADGCRNVVVNFGDTLQFFNADVPGSQGGPGHRVIEVYPYGPPRFQSEIVPLGAVAEVVGVPGLSYGRYSFSCTIHPDMKGKIDVFSAGFGPG
jgi:hypothetical protein